MIVQCVRTPDDSNAVHRNQLDINAYYSPFYFTLIDASGESVHQISVNGSSMLPITVE